MNKIKGEHNYLSPFAVHRTPVSSLPRSSVRQELLSRSCAAATNCLPYSPSLLARRFWPPKSFKHNFENPEKGLVAGSSCVVSLRNNVTLLLSHNTSLFGPVAIFDTLKLTVINRVLFEEIFHSILQPSSPRKRSSLFSL